MSMMQSVALNESTFCVVDDDYIVVDVAAAAATAPSHATMDPMAEILDCEDGVDDDDSYDYCDDAMHEMEAMAAPSYPSSTRDRMPMAAVLVDDSENANVDTLLDVASSMLCEVVGWETDLDAYGGKAESMEVSATELDFMPSSEQHSADCSVTPSSKDSYSIQLDGHLGAVIADTGAAAAAAVTTAPALGAPTVVAASHASSDKVTAAATNPASKGTTMSTGSRPSNKKRRKQMKMAKKAAAAAYLAQLASNDPRPPTMTDPIARTRHLLHAESSTATTTTTSCGSQLRDEGFNTDGPASASTQSLLA